MKYKLIDLKDKTFFKNVLIMATGTVGAQVIIVLLAPIITRLYGPEAYGLVGVFNSIIAVIGPVAALTYPIAIVLPKRDKEAKNILKLSLLISVLMSVFIGIILLLFNQSIVKIFNLYDIASFIYLIPLVILLTGFMQSLEQWLIRKQQFKSISNATLYSTLFIQGGKVSIGLFYPLGWILIVLTTIGNGIKALLLWISIKEFKFSLNFIIKFKFNFRKLRVIARKYYDFPTYRAPESFISTVSLNLPVLLLSSFFGPIAVGYYTIGRTVLALPSNLIGKAIGDVFYPQASQIANKGESITKLIIKTTLLLALVGAIPFGIIVIFGPWIFSFVFGAEWFKAGEYARWMALWVFFGFINKPSVKSLPILNAQFFQLKFTIFMLIIRSIALISGYYLLNNDIAAIALFAIAGGILNIILILLTIKISNDFPKRQRL